MAGTKEQLKNVADKLKKLQKADETGVENMRKAQKAARKKSTQVTGEKE